MNPLLTLGLSWWLAAAVAAGPTQRSLLADLETLDRGLCGAELRIAQLDAEITQAVHAAAEAQTELAAARIAYRSSFERLRKRVRALARAAPSARLTVLVDSRTLSDYLARKRLLRSVARYDKRMHEQLASERDRLTAIEGAAVKTREARVRLAQEARATRAEMAARRRDRLELLRSVVRSQEMAARAAREMQEASRGLGRLLERLAPDGPPASTFEANRGRLPWPTAGRVRAPHGGEAARDGNAGKAGDHPGIDLEAPAGTPVQAVAPGKVAFADWLHGYGQLVILEHQGAYHTLVAHLATVEVEVGQQVAQGQTIGTVGDTGSLDGTVLYFELRHRGRPIHPLDWLRRG